MSVNCTFIFIVFLDLKIIFKYPSHSKYSHELLYFQESIFVSTIKYILIVLTIWRRLERLAITVDNDCHCVVSLWLI